MGAPVASAPRRALVVDDSPTARLSLAVLLEDLGWKVNEAPHGAAALECFRQSPWELVTLDARMPVMDGIEACREMRRLEVALGRRTPILGISGDMDVELAERFLLAGADAYLQKPIDTSKLRNIVGPWS